MVDLRFRIRGRGNPRMDIPLVEERVAKDRRTALEKRDVWEMLLAALKEQDDGGVLVQFWLILRKADEADPDAKAGTFEERMEAMSDITALDL